MALRIGAVIGLAVFCGILVIGLLQSNEIEDILGNGLVGFWIAFLAGWLLFGPLGLSLADREPARAPPEEPRAKPGQQEEKKTPIGGT